MGRGGFGGYWGRSKFGRFGTQQAPVNIEETDTNFVISLYAAGLNKDQVKLTVKDDLLIISYPGHDQSANTDQPGNYTYQEYSQRSFERSFRLNNKVSTELITASYADGILKVVLPKNPDTNKPAQAISID
ncbi:MAG: heat-shock protein Hsp20 [Spirosoma sp.]|nr:heat-shock protein Hsp20 [Spirosoma sp.]